MVHVLKDQIEGALVLSEIKRVLLVRHNLFQVDDVAMVELAQDLDLAYGRDRKSLLLVLETYLLQRYHVAGSLVLGLVHLAVCTLADLCHHFERVHAAHAPLLVQILQHLLAVDDRTVDFGTRSLARRHPPQAAAGAPLAARAQRTRRRCHAAHVVVRTQLFCAGHHRRHR